MNIEVKNSEKPVDYNESMKILEKRVDAVSKGKVKELLWILEHNITYTAGASSIESDLIDKNIKIVKTNRGGKHTLHAPGQKVVYFVLNLNKREKDIRFLINQIEKCIINVLKEYKIASFGDKKNIGVWVNNKNKTEKIAAIGIKVKKWGEMGILISLRVYPICFFLILYLNLFIWCILCKNANVDLFFWSSCSNFSERSFLER